MPEAPALQMKLITAVGDKLDIRSIVGAEAVSQLFTYDILALSEDATVSADDLLGTPVAVGVETRDGTQRWFHGLVASFGIDGVDGSGRRFRHPVFLLRLLVRFLTHAGAGLPALRQAFRFP